VCFMVSYGVVVLPETEQFKFLMTEVILIYILRIHMEELIVGVM